MDMTRRFAFCLILVVVLANAGATCLYSGAGPTTPTSFSQEKPWNPALEAIANLLTLPLPTAGSADVRDVVLPVGLGIVLLMLAVHFARPRATTPSGSPEDGAGTAAAEDNPAEKWLIRTAIGVTILAVLSALLNQSLDLSWAGSSVSQLERPGPSSFRGLSRPRRRVESFSACWRSRWSRSS